MSIWRYWIWGLELRGFYVKDESNGRRWYSKCYCVCEDKMSFSSHARFVACYDCSLHQDSVLGSSYISIVPYNKREATAHPTSILAPNTIQRER